MDMKNLLKMCPITSHSPGFSAWWLHKWGNFCHPFPLFSLNFHSEKPRVPRIDFSDVKDLDSAYRKLHRMLNMKDQPSVKAYTILLDLTAKMHHYSSALNMFVEMRIRNVSVNEYTTNVAINCLCTEKNVDSGFALMGFLLKNGYDPDAVTFSTLITGLFAVDRVKDAVIMFRKVMDLNLCEPNGIIILAVIDGLCKAEEIDAADVLIRELETSEWKPCVKAYNALLDGFCKGRGVDSAIEIRARMMDRGIQPDVITYNTIIQGLCSEDRLEEVDYMIDEMRKYRISPDVFTYNTLISAYSKHLLRNAEIVMAVMIRRNIRPDIITYNSLMEYYCRLGKLDKARKVFDSLRGWGIKPSIVSFTTLIDGYCRGRRVDEAWELFLQVPGKGLEYDVTTYSAMLHGFLSDGYRFAEGYKLYKDMEKGGVSPNLHTHTIMLDGLFMIGKVDDALSLLGTIEEKGETVDITMYGAVINGLCKNGELDAAIDIVHKLPSRGLQPNVVIYTTIIISLMKAGRVKEAEHWRSEMESRFGCGPY